MYISTVEKMSETPDYELCLQVSNERSKMVTYLIRRILKSILDTYNGFPDILIIEWLAHDSRIQKKPCLLLFWGLSASEEHLLV